MSTQPDLAQQVSKPASSPRRIAASRANGALSKGPKSEAGKQRSAFNARRHGMLSRSTLIEDESPAQFKKLHLELIEKFEPTNGFEDHCIEEIAHAEWRLRRTRTIETTLFVNVTERDDFHEFTEDRVTNAFRRIAEPDSLPLLLRYQASMYRAKNNAIKHLQMARASSARPANPPAGCPTCDS